MRLDSERIEGARPTSCRGRCSPQMKVEQGVERSIELWFLLPCEGIFFFNQSTEDILLSVHDYETLAAFFV